MYQGWEDTGELEKRKQKKNMMLLFFFQNCETAHSITNPQFRRFNIWREEKGRKWMLYINEKSSKAADHTGLWPCQRHHGSVQLLLSSAYILSIRCSDSTLGEKKRWPEGKNPTYALRYSRSTIPSLRKRSHLCPHRLPRLVLQWVRRSEPKPWADAGELTLLIFIYFINKTPVML